MKNGRKEHPIIFSGPMVRAILEGRKTQTRRVLKPRGGDTFFGAPRRIDCHELESGGYGFFSEERDYRCPYGCPGDRLWVRETHRMAHPTEPLIMYRANEAIENIDVPVGAETVWESGNRWRPSIHMPKWAARIWLEVTAVHVERLQEIVHNDAIHEGVVPMFTESAQRQLFQQLWDGINAKRGFAWESNPRVWVIEFRRTMRRA